jgi:mRNA interferase RelE/StbE
MVVKFHKQAIKFLQRANPEDVVNIQAQLRQLLIAVEEQGIIPFTVLDIKKMKGEWDGFYRLRVGKIRVIFTVSLDYTDIEIHRIGARGDVYK